jgi:hypothetical protein
MTRRCRARACQIIARYPAMICWAETSVYGTKIGSGGAAANSLIPKSLMPTRMITVPMPGWSRTPQGSGATPGTGSHRFWPTIRRSARSSTRPTCESLNSRFRQATRRCGHFPTEQAAFKVLYLVVREKNRKGKDIVARINGWKVALNAFALSYGDRITNN